MSCSNCYSGCTEIGSDKCIKYTGMDIPILGIKNGDSINYVQAAIMGFLISTLDGTGIKYELDAGNLCDIVSNELQDCADITVVDITNALSAAICALDSRVTVLENANTVLEGAYSPLCVPGIAGTEGTHIVVQAVIEHLCTVTTDLDALELDVNTNYVQIADINTYIANYLGGIGSGTEQKLKMVPYTVMEYYGDLSYFDATGAGIGDWAEIYLCNGNNGAPDKRGRIAVGTTSGMGGGAFPSATDPLISGNPTYLLYTTTGNNVVTLSEAELPSHTHTTNVNASLASHSHNMVRESGSATPLTASIPLVETETYDGNRSYTLAGTLSGEANLGKTSTESPTLTVTVSNNSTGGGGSHNNIPPVLACHYIIYIPTT
jgi:microcystin-dependent protein